MIELKQDKLIFSFPEIHPKARCTIEFQRTLRLPDDNREYPLPPGLGQFPLMHVDDLGDRLPPEWEKRGGIFFPMYQAEAMWIKFDSDYPFAIKIAAGKINAITGDAWLNELHADPQDYLILPSQPWLDGFCAAKGKIRQFIAMPLGDGYTAEEQLMGRAEHGGIQIIAFPMKLDVYKELFAYRLKESEIPLINDKIYFSRASKKDVSEMGFAPGGLMRQKIYDDYYGFSAWDTNASSRCFVHIVNSQEYHNLTGNLPPTKVYTAQDYTQAGLPWFEYYDENSAALSGKDKLSGLNSVAAFGIKKNLEPLPDNESVIPVYVKDLSIFAVREGKF